MTFHTLENGNTRIRARFAADLGAVDELALSVRRILKSAGLGKMAFVAELLAREVLNNAVVHGCHEERAKSASFCFEISGERIVIEVEDDGPGFDWQAAMQRAADPEVPGGRGMGILKQFAHEVIFNEKGNGVKLVLMVPGEEIRD
jgi:serine/threonine-protein kinase RsbW